MPQTAKCSACGTALTVGVPGHCPACGSEQRTVAVEMSISVGMQIHTTYAVTGSNGAEAGILQLHQALDLLDDIVVGGPIQDVQVATKRALEAIHELEDGRRVRSEWQQTGWGADQLGLWQGLLGARNAAHHSSSPVVTRHGPNSHEREDRLRWHLEPQAIRSLRSKDQRREYNARLDGLAVLPQLHEVLALVQRATA